MLSDDKLIDQIKYGNERAAEELITRYYASILRYCRWHLSSVEKAEDLTQEIFYKLFKNISGYQGKRKFKAYLYTIARLQRKESIWTCAVVQEMFDAARTEDVYPVVREGYRTAEEQQEILDDKIQSYINQGYSQVKAERTAKEWVALPGTSEHQLGIAVDINADKSKCSNEDVYAWLAENAYKYGFVLRYPPGKQKITGTSYEPWHYRYVGEEAAKEIYERGICLEEYFKQVIEEVGL